MKFLAALISYFLGAFPNAYLIGKYLYHDDVRNYGSGNPGATNAYRAFGVKGGVLTLILDFLKGYLAVYFSRKLAGDPGLIIGIIFAILGHMYTYMLKFKGGKGVATAAGCVLAISAKVFRPAIIVFLITFLVTRIVSISSMLGCLTAMIAMFIICGSTPISWTVACVVILIIYRHKSNIGRLYRGEEKKLF